MLGSRKIRVAHIITRMDRGGAPDIVRLLFENFPQEDFELTLIYGRTRTPSLKSARFLESLKERAVLVDALRRDINPFFDLAAFSRLYSLLRRGRFDIVHTHTAKAGVLGRIAAKMAGVRFVVYSPHGHVFYGYFGSLGSWLVTWAEKIASLFCDKIHVLTELEKQDFVSYRICPSSKIEVIYSGVEISVLRPSQALRERLKNASQADQKLYQVGFVGRLEPVKGPQYYLEAARLVLEKKKNVAFLVVGDGSLREELQEQVRAAGISDRVSFSGWQEDVNPVLLNLDLLVLPSINEAVGRSALEAQAAGIPVVATKVGGVPEVVKDGVTGILVPPKDARVLSVAIVNLLSDDKKRQEMGEAAKGWVDEKFSDRVMVNRFEEMYRELIEDRG